MKRLILFTILYTLTFSNFAQNSPLFIWGTGLDGSTYQKTAIYSDLALGLLFEAPKDAAGNKLPIQFNWRGSGVAPLHINNLGNVGVGTSSPQTKFQIMETAAGMYPGGATANNGILISGYGTGGALNMGVDGSGTSNPLFYSWIQSRNRDISNYYALALNPAGGSVGVGTIAPTGQLHLASNSDHEFKMTRVNGAFGFRILRNAVNGRFLIQNTDDTNIWGTRIQIEEGGSSWQNLFLNPNGGNVAIGSMSANANLQIGQSTMNGLINLGGYSNIGSLKSSGDLFAGMNTYAQYNSSADDSKIKVLNSNAYGFSAVQMSYTGDISFYSKSGTVTANDQVNTSANTVMKITGGNVGIGTPSPDAKLAVKGSVHAQEVKVDLLVPGPDYVFENDYDLLSLTEIKTYIDKNKHLPEVPSAKEMEANGVNLGEMNMLLLKKIEELTLHVIEQNKLIINQNERITSLEKSIHK